MPSISQADLKQLHADLEYAKNSAVAERAKAREAELRINTFDAILEKIIRAADGVPLGNKSEYLSHYSPRAYSITSPMDPMRRPTAKERREQEVRTLNERIVTLESQLAAVRAVAEFAKSHKA